MKIARTVLLLLATISTQAFATKVYIDTASDLRHMYWCGNSIYAQVNADIYVTPDTSGLWWDLHPIITSPGGVNCLFSTYEPDISMTFDGSGSSVYEVHRFGQIEFDHLSDITFKNIHRKAFTLLGTALSGTISGYGGVINACKGGVCTDGGIIFHSLTSVTFDNIKFNSSQWGTDENYWVAGAALYTQDGAQVKFDGAYDVTMNNVGIWHEGYYAPDSGRDFEAKGGAVYTHNMLITRVSHLTISNNYIYKKHQQGIIVGHGGAFHLRDNSYFSNVNEALFSGNNVRVANEAEGGAIYLDSEATLTVNEETELKFLNNYVKADTDNSDYEETKYDGAFVTEPYKIYARGGAISMDNKTSFIVKDGKDLVFEGNYATGTYRGHNDEQTLHVAGGAIYAANDATLEFDLSIWNGVSFLNNSVSAHIGGASEYGVAEGGAIAIGENSVLKFFDNEYVSFVGNKVEGDVSTMRGGAISAGSGSLISIFNNPTVTFSNNSVAGGMGSAIYSEGTIEMGSGHITFSGNEGYAIYMKADSLPASTAHLHLAPGASDDTILFDNDKLYAVGTDSTPFSMVVDSGGAVIFRGESSGATIENGSAEIVSARLVLEDGASFSADELKVGTEGTLSAIGYGNSLSGTLTMAGTLSTLSMNVGAANICTLQDGALSGNAVMNMDVIWALEQNGFTFNVVLDEDVTGKGVYQLLELSNAFDKNLWTSDQINVTGDILFSDLRWNDEGTKLFYARVGGEGHAGDRTWTNIAGSGNWNFNARNWKLTGAENNGDFDGILYVDSTSTDSVGVHFTDECTSTVDVSITSAVNPRDITVNATRDYTFADGGGKITGATSLIKKGSGTLTIALDNDFVGTAENPGVTLQEGVIRVQANKALGEGAVVTAEGTTLIYENNVTSSLGASGTKIAGNIEVLAGATLTADLSGDVEYAVRTQIVDGTMKFTGSDAFGGDNRFSELGGTGKLLVEGSNLGLRFRKIELFYGDLEINGTGNGIYVRNSGYSGNGNITLNGQGNRLNLVDRMSGLHDGYMPFRLTAGGSLNMHGGSILAAKAVYIGNGAVLAVSGRGNTIETDFDPEIMYTSVLWLSEDATLDMTISAENAMSVRDDEAVLNVPFMLKAQNGAYNILIRADMGSAFREDTSYTLLNMTGATFYLGDYNENWTPDTVHVMGDAIFEDLSWADEDTSSWLGNSFYKLVFNAPDAVVWRDSAGTGVWNTEGDKNWKRFTAADSSVFYSGDNVRFTDTCTSEADVSITEEITPGSILVRADRDYTFADGGGTIAGSGKLTKQGEGELTIALDNTFTGGVQLDEGTLRLHADKALGSGQLTMKDGTSLIVENGADVVLAQDGNVIKGKVSIAEHSALTVSSNSTYTTAATTVDGTLKLSGNFRSGSSATLSGGGYIVMNATAGSSAQPVTFEVAKSEGFGGNIVVQGNHNVLKVAEGGYKGSGRLEASGKGAEINFEGQNVDIGEAGMLFVNEGGKLVAENLTLTEMAMLVATNTDTVFDSDIGLPTMTPMERFIYEQSNYVSSGRIEAASFTLEGGTHYVQSRGFYSLAHVGQLVFDASNGKNFTLSTNLSAYREGDALYYLLFTDVAQYTVEGDMNFYVVGEHPAQSATLVCHVNEWSGAQTLLLKTMIVPEPTTATLSLLALAGLAARRRRRG